jgi:hypothetical protein
MHCRGGACSIERERRSNSTRHVCMRIRIRVARVCTQVLLYLFVAQQCGGLSLPDC